MIDKKIVIGCGTGRCGTMTLSRILQTNGIAVSHEMNSSVLRLPYNIDLDKFKRLCEYFDKLNNVIVGDVDLVYLSYLELFIKRYSNIKIICLKRDKHKTIKSFIRKSKGKNWWSDICLEKVNMIRFPKYQTNNLEEAIGLYWDFYYSEIEKIKGRYPDKIIIIKTEELSTEKEQDRIFDFVGVSSQNRRYCSEIYNKS